MRQSILRICFRIMLAVPLVLAGASPALSAPVVDESPEAAPTTAGLYDRIACLGASATDGYFVSIPAPDGDGGQTDIPITLGDIFRAGLPDSHAVSCHASMFFFMRPMNVGPALLKKAEQHDPTVIIAVDWLFWYGYGNRDHAGQPIVDEDQRLELLDAGLNILDDVDVPLIVGDFPDMSPAVGRMISRSQMPEPESLTRLSERVRQWADERDHVHVFPMAEMVETLRRGEAVTFGRYEWSDDQAAGLIQDDELHPTLDGLIALAQAIVHDYDAANDADLAATFNLDPAVVRARLADVAAALMR